MKISIVLPVYNESENLPILLKELHGVLGPITKEYEIIAVNDGSRDNTSTVLKNLSNGDKKLKVIHFLTNCGQTAALMAGISNATGDIIIPMDSDLENDPNDIPKLLEKIDDGYDVVSGWRVGRWQGSFITRKLPSITANWLISKITRLPLHDYGCILKAYKRDILKGVELYGEMHRFIPAYASWKGAKVTEVVVNHRPRRFGKSNYGISRTFRVLLDLLLIKFLHKYMNRPIHFFGSVGFASFGLGLLVGIISILLKLNGISFISTPLPVLCVFFIIVSAQFIGMGILAEIQMRTYYESQKKTPFIVRETNNI